LAASPPRRIALFYFLFFIEHLIRKLLPIKNAASLLKSNYKINAVLPAAAIHFLKKQFETLLK
jgi:hypothetical protein